MLGIGLAISPSFLSSCTNKNLPILVASTPLHITTYRVNLVIPLTTSSLKVMPKNIVAYLGIPVNHMRVTGLSQTVNLACAAKLAHVTSNNSTVNIGIASRTMVITAKSLCVQVEPAVKSCKVTGYITVISGYSAETPFIPTPTWTF